MKQKFLILGVLIVGIVLISGCIQQAEEPEKEKLSEDYLAENPTSCNVASDCHIEFEHCGCSNICRNIYHGPLKDCAFACPEEMIDESIQFCECINNECVQKLCLNTDEICQTNEQCCSNDCVGRPCGPGPCTITAYCA